MLIIKKLSKMIKEEICDAEKYANCALHYKEEDKDLADTFYNLANEELKHMNMLHDQVTRIIKAYRATKKPSMSGMVTGSWNWFESPSFSTADPMAAKSEA